MAQQSNTAAWRGRQSSLSMDSLAVDDLSMEDKLAIWKAAKRGKENSSILTSKGCAAGVKGKGSTSPKTEDSSLRPPLVQASRGGKTTNTLRASSNAKVVLPRFSQLSSSAEVGRRLPRASSVSAATPTRGGSSGGVHHRAQSNDPVRVRNSSLSEPSDSAKPRGRPPRQDSPANNTRGVKHRGRAAVGSPGYNTWGGTLRKRSPSPALTTVRSRRLVSPASTVQRRSPSPASAGRKRSPSPAISGKRRSPSPAVSDTMRPPPSMRWEPPTPATGKDDVDLKVNDVLPPLQQKSRLHQPQQAAALKVSVTPPATDGKTRCTESQLTAQQTSAVIPTAKAQIKDQSIDSMPVVPAVHKEEDLPMPCQVESNKLEPSSPVGNTTVSESTSGLGGGDGLEGEGEGDCGTTADGCVAFGKARSSSTLETDTITVGSISAIITTTAWDESLAPTEPRTGDASSVGKDQGSRATLGMEQTVDGDQGARGTSLSHGTSDVGSDCDGVAAVTVNSLDTSTSIEGHESPVDVGVRFKKITVNTDSTVQAVPSKIMDSLPTSDSGTINSNVEVASINKSPISEVTESTSFVKIRPHCQSGVEAGMGLLLLAQSLPSLEGVVSEEKGLVLLDDKSPTDNREARIVEGAREDGVEWGSGSGSGIGVAGQSSDRGVNIDGGGVTEDEAGAMDGGDCAGFAHVRGNSGGFADKVDDRDKDDGKCNENLPQPVANEARNDQESCWSDARGHKESNGAATRQLQGSCGRCYTGSAASNVVKVKECSEGVDSEEMEAECSTVKSGNGRRDCSTDTGCPLGSTHVQEEGEDNEVEMYQEYFVEGGGICIDEDLLKTGSSDGDGNSSIGRRSTLSEGMLMLLRSDGPSTPHVAENEVVLQKRTVETRDIGMQAGYGRVLTEEESIRVYNMEEMRERLHMCSEDLATGAFAQEVMKQQICQLSGEVQEGQKRHKAEMAKLRWAHADEIARMEAESENDGDTMVRVTVEMRENFMAKIKKLEKRCETERKMFEVERKARLEAEATLCHLRERMRKEVKGSEEQD
ncbi:unnamed protein product [Choristocarpus tenellus]